MPGEWKEYIAIDLDVLDGEPHIKGTQIPVSLIVAHLAAGKRSQEIAAQFPGLTREQIRACRAYAREMAEFEATE